MAMSSRTRINRTPSDSDSWPLFEWNTHAEKIDTFFIPVLRNFQDDDEVVKH